MDEGWSEFSFAGAGGLELRAVRGGSGRTVILVHGFMADAELNWIAPRVAGAMREAGFHVVMPDLRGHGRSPKPSLAEDWPPDVLTDDLFALVRALEIQDYDLVGYSLGARTAVRALVRGARPRRAVLGGMGAEGVLRPDARARAFSEAIRLGPHASDPRLGRRVQRTIADRRLDPGTLELCLASMVATPREALAGITAPTLVVAGVDDEDNGSPEALQALLPDARVERTPGDHLGAVAAPEFTAALRLFLCEASPA